MITVYKKYDTTSCKDGNVKEIEIRGLSTDRKPTDVCNGTIFIEINTGDIYMYDLENKIWQKINSNNGGNINVIDIMLPETFSENYLSDSTKYGTSIEVTNESDIEFFSETFQRVNNNKNAIFRIVYANNIIQYVSSIMLDNNMIYVIAIEGVGLIGNGYASINLIADYSGADTNYYVLTKVYSFSN